MTRYICSRCGYSRQSPEPVVEHIVQTHQGQARVMEQEDTETEPTVLGRVVHFLQKRL